MEWVSVEERLPEMLEKLPHLRESAYVLACHEPLDSLFAAPSPWILYLYQIRDDEPRWAWIGENKPGKVTHWMHLPKAPE